MKNRSHWIMVWGLLALIILFTSCGESEDDRTTLLISLWEGTVEVTSGQELEVQVEDGFGQFGFTSADFKTSTERPIPSTERFDLHNRGEIVVNAIIKENDVILTTGIYRFESRAFGFTVRLIRSSLLITFDDPLEGCFGCIDAVSFPIAPEAA